MNIEVFVKRVGPFVPLLIAAGYFIFLIGTWSKFLAFQQTLTDKFDQRLEALTLKDVDPNADQALQFSSQRSGPGNYNNQSKPTWYRLGCLSDRLCARPGCTFTPDCRPY
jgi:hypothetical protein